MSLQRGHALLEIKSVDTAQRIIRGVASTPTVDHGGDSMDPLGARFSLPLPFLWMHGDPIGEVYKADPQADGIYIEAKIAAVAPNAPASLRDRVETAWHSISSNPPLVRGLSIGWSPLKSAAIPGTKFRRISEWIWGELSAVTIPMNREATILSVKHFDQASTAALGQPPILTPGVTGSSRKHTTMTTASEQIQTEQAVLQTKSARFAELMADEVANGGLETEESTERDTLQHEIDAHTSKIARLKTLEAAQAAQAAPVAFSSMNQYGSAATRTSSRTYAEMEQKDYPAWFPFVRATMAKAIGRKEGWSLSDIVNYAKRWERETPEVIQFLKAVPGTTDAGSPAWGSQLVPLETGRAFMDQLMPATILGRLNLVPTPFLTRIVEQMTGATIDWVGQVGKKPVGELSFTDFSMPRHKMAGIVVISDELARSSQPDAEEVVRRSLNRQITKFMDRQFIDISVGAGANNPASITNSATPIPATGADINAMLSDFNTALATFDSSDLGTEGLAIVTTPAVARGLSMMLSALGNRQFPEMSPTGGSVLGYTVIVSNNVPSGDIVFIKQDQVRISSDRQIVIDASNQATLDMGDGNPFNLWQMNCTGLRAETYVTWLKDRDEAVAVISGAAYGPSVGSP